jgi:hypothetical protein
VPQDHGKIERWHRTIQHTWFRGLPGFKEGPAEYLPNKDVKMRYHVGDKKSLPSTEQIIEYFDTVIRETNENAVLDKFDSTRIERWCAGTNMVRRAHPAAFWDAMLPAPRREYTVQPSGVYVDGTYYADDYGRGLEYAPLPLSYSHLAGSPSWQSCRIGPAGNKRTVEVRVLPSPAYGRAVFVGENGRYLGRAANNEKRTEDQVDAARSENRARARHARALLREAGALAEDESGLTPAESQSDADLGVTSLRTGTQAGKTPKNKAHLASAKALRDLSIDEPGAA